jgi:hypothetical protein
MCSKSDHFLFLLTLSFNGRIDNFRLIFILYIYIYKIMADQLAGDANDYTELLNSLAEGAKNTIGDDKLGKAADVLNKINMTNVALQQFGFYKRLQEGLKSAAKETVSELKEKLGAPKQLLGTEGTELQEVKPLTEGLQSEELAQTERGVFGRQILGEKPPISEISPTVESGIPTGEVGAGARPFTGAGEDYVSLEQRIAQNAARPSQAAPRNLFDDYDAALDNEMAYSRAPLFFGERSVADTARASGQQPPSEIEPAAEPVRPSAQQRPDETTAPEDVANVKTPEQIAAEAAEAQANEALATTQNLAEEAVGLNTLGGETQKIAGSFLGKFSDLYNQALDVKTALVQNLKDEANQKVAQGRQLIQDGQDALSRGEEGAQDLINQGQGVVDNALKQAANSDLVQQNIGKAQDYIKQGTDLLNSGKQEGMTLIEQGREQLQAAQSTIQSYGAQGRALAQNLQTEIEARGEQLSNLAETVASRGQAAVQVGTDVVKAAASGDVEGAVQGAQTGVKLAGKVAGDLGIQGGEEIAAGISDAIPVVGEIVSAGLLISSLFTTIADAFKPHEVLPTLAASSQYGI